MLSVNFDRKVCIQKKQVCLVYEIKPYSLKGKKVRVLNIATYYNAHTT
jgi:hypothetical protein